MTAFKSKPGVIYCKCSVRCVCPARVTGYCSQTMFRDHICHEGWRYVMGVGWRCPVCSAKKEGGQ